MNLYCSQMLLTHSLSLIAVIGSILNSLVICSNPVAATLISKVFYPLLQVDDSCERL